MIRQTIFVFATLLYLFPNTAPAAAQGMSGIGVIDMQLLQRESSATKSIQAQLAKRDAAYKQELTKQENELRKVEQELSQQRALISPEAFAERRRQFEQRVNNLQRDGQNRKRELDKSFATAMRTVENVLKDIVEQMVKEKRLTLVLNKGHAIYASAEYDITDEVMKRLNAKLPSVNVAAPAKPPVSAAKPPATKPPPAKAPPPVR